MLFRSLALSLIELTFKRFSISPFMVELFMLEFLAPYPNLSIRFGAPVARSTGTPHESQVKGADFLEAHQSPGWDCHCVTANFISPRAAGHPFGLSQPDLFFV